LQAPAAWQLFCPGGSPAGASAHAHVEHLFYPVACAMPPLGCLDSAWVETEAAMPLGWHLDPLRCSSTGLAPEQRSSRWLAVAVRPAGDSSRPRAVSQWQRSGPWRDCCGRSGGRWAD